MPTSLRTTLLTGLVLLNLAVIGGITAVAYSHLASGAREALRVDLCFRARTLADILEIDDDGPEFEATPRALPEYYTRESGAYAAIFDPAGKAIVRSPSLGADSLEPASPWSDDAFDLRDLDPGPGGIPCVAVTHSFHVRVEGAATASNGWTPPSEAERRYQIVVARDARPLAEELAELRVFLGAVAAGALAITVLGGLFVTRRVLGPIRRMTAEAAALSPEDTSRRLRPETVVRELASLSETLNSALDRLGDALDRRRRFVSDASHELRTPLAVLRGNVDLLLRRERSGAEYRAGLERQSRIAARMTEITENLLALARSDADRADVRRERVDLPALARSVCDEFVTAAREKHLSLECVTDESVAVEGDATYLGGLVQNLVSNAVKFSPYGGSVRVGLARMNGHAVLDVADSGPGIPPEARGRIFHRFFRVRDGSDPGEGAGLGLAIVEWTVRAHAGEIEVLAREGGGTIMRVRLPACD